MSIDRGGRSISLQLLVRVLDPYVYVYAPRRQQHPLPYSLCQIAPPGHSIPHSNRPKYPIPQPPHPFPPNLKLPLPRVRLILPYKRQQPSQ